MILQQIDKEILDLANRADKDLKDAFERIDSICLANSNSPILSKMKYDGSMSTGTKVME